MENPKTPETLEAQNPGDTTPEEASGSPGLINTVEKYNGLAFVSGISMEENGIKVDAHDSDGGVGNVDVPAQVVGVKKRTEDIEGEVRPEFNVIEPCLNVADVEKVNGCVAGENEAQMGSVDLHSNKENDTEMGLGSRVDGSLEGLSGNGNGGLNEDKLLELDGIDSSGADSAGKTEVSAEGISLFVDFSGSPSRFIHNDLHMENGSPLIAIHGSLKEAEDEELDKGIAANQDYNFSVGDIVWVKTKNRTWWPGKIYDPIDASKYDAKSGQGDCLLVGYFGISHVAWCRRSQLKPFHENFEQMSSKNKARIFLGAVEKAVDEFGKLVKLEMACPCSLKENKLSAGAASTIEGALRSKHKTGELGIFSITHFESEKFLGHLKNLARVVSMPCLLDLAATSNRLSAFYCFIGHSQLPMHLLFETDDAEDIASNISITKHNFDQNYSNKAAEEGSNSSESRKRKTEKDYEAEGLWTILHKSPTTNERKASRLGEVVSGIEKGFDSRERKKSRYLSYPYINLEQKSLPAEKGNLQVLKSPHEGENAKVGAGVCNGSPSNLKCSGEKFWKKWYRKSNDGRNISGNSKLINASSSELFSDLCSTAVDCLYLSENKKFDSVGWFFSRFRISVYHDESVYETNHNGQNEAKDTEACFSGNNPQDTKHLLSASKSELKRAKKKAYLKHSEDEHTANLSNAIGRNATSIQDVNENLDTCLGKDNPMMRKKRGPDNLGKLKTKPLSGLSDVNISIATSSLLVKDALDKGVFIPSSEHKRKKKKMKEGLTPVSMQTSAIPDLNGNSATVSLLIDDQVIDRIASEDHADGLLNKTDEGSAAKHSNSTAYDSKPGLTVKEPQMIGLISDEGKPGVRKRKIKEKSVAKHLSAGIPDLNGTTAESNSFGKELSETNGLTPPVKPEPKKRWRKGQDTLKPSSNVSAAGRLDIHINYDRVGTNGETIGTALFLTFAPGVSMPSKEDLASTFCKFGPLRESETQLLKDPGSAQIVFMQATDAEEAFQSLEKSNPFGENLIKYELRHVSPLSKVLESGQTLHTSLASPPVDEIANSVKPSGSNLQPGGAPNLDFIKKNLQMMTSMLEKSGDNLSPEMRSKLENEINGLLKKVSFMTGCSS
ncbi:hypothetical protein FNV43_RR19780 [Rhamnella rubrinervis]|uniref:PWWP domain-containing protein n=1 Tax=Rhamnella rubrinervis TaxID=2594499 RepID=A0A8K0DTA3_9ROSA|nr:hypothetical protein FNV43_RR19780 [Rhamnella rubrinervis]